MEVSIPPTNGELEEVVLVTHDGCTLNANANDDGSVILMIEGRKRSRRSYSKIKRISMYFDY